MKKHKENQIIYAFITGFRYVEPVAAPIEKRDSPKPRIQLVCAFCKTTFAISPSSLKTARYCSNPCRYEAFRAKNLAGRNQIA